MGMAQTGCRTISIVPSRQFGVGRITENKIGKKGKYYLQVRVMPDNELVFVFLARAENNTRHTDKTIHNE